MDGYQLFLTENYHVQPFRLFMELDFDWEAPGEFYTCLFRRLPR